MRKALHLDSTKFGSTSWEEIVWTSKIAAGLVRWWFDQLLAQFVEDFCSFVSIEKLLAPFCLP